MSVIPIYKFSMLFCMLPNMAANSANYPNASVTGMPSIPGWIEGQRVVCCKKSLSSCSSNKSFASKLKLFQWIAPASKCIPMVLAALKKRPPIHRQIQRRLDHQNSSGCRRCQNSHNLCLIPGTCAWCADRAAAHLGVWSRHFTDSSIDGSHLWRWPYQATCIGALLYSGWLI